MQNDIKTNDYWLNVVDWFYRLGVCIYQYAKENPFPKRQDIIKTEVDGVERLSGEHSEVDKQP
jgi:hypothetical protein